MLVVKSGFILFIKSYQFSTINTLEREWWLKGDYRTRLVKMQKSKFGVCEVCTDRRGHDLDEETRAMHSRECRG